MDTSIVITVEYWLACKSSDIQVDWCSYFELNAALSQLMERWEPTHANMLGRSLPAKWTHLSSTITSVSTPSIVGVIRWQKKQNLAQCDLLAETLRSPGIVMSVHSFSKSVDGPNVPRTEVGLLCWQLAAPVVHMSRPSCESVSGTRGRWNGLRPDLALFCFDSSSSCFFRRAFR